MNDEKNLMNGEADSEERKNTIVYDDDWKNASPTVYYEEPKDSEAFDLESKKPKKEGTRQLLITMQLILCLIIAIAALLLKTFGGEVYDNVREWYYNELNKSITADTYSSENYLSELFGEATEDEL